MLRVIDLEERDYELILAAEQVIEKNLASIILGRLYARSQDGFTLASIWKRTWAELPFAGKQ